MTPVSIEIKDFLGIRELKFDFNPGVYVMVGRNGSGKSSFFEALLFSLYGRGIRHDARLVKAYIRNGADRAILRFKFKRDEKIYEVIREISEKGASIAALYEVFRDGNRKRLASSPASVNKKIEQILRIDRDTFLRTFLIAQGEIDKLANEFKKGVRNLIMKMSGFDEMKQNLKDKLNNYLKDLNSQGVEKLIQELKKDLAEKGTEEELRRRRKDLYEKRTKLLEEILKLDETITKLNNYEFLYGEKEKLKEYKKRESDILKLAEKERRAEVVEKLKPLIDLTREVEENVQRKRQQLIKLKKDVDNFTREINLITYDLKKKEEMLTTLEKGLELLENKQKKMQDIIESTREAVNELKIIQSRLTDIKQEKEYYENERKKLLSNISNLEKELIDLKEKADRLLKEKEELEKLELEWMAFRISESLEDGDICPVCGGTFYKSNKKDTFLFDKGRYQKILEMYEKLNERVARKSENLNGRKEKLMEISDILKEKNDKYKQLVERKNELVRFLKSAGYYTKIESDLKKVEQELKSKRKDYEKTWKSYKDLENNLKLIEKDIERSQEKIDTLKNEISESEKTLSEQKERVTKELEKSGIKMEEVEEYLNFGKKGYQKELERIRAQIESIEERLKNVDKDIDEMYKKLKNLKSQKEGIHRNLENINQEIGKIDNVIKNVRHLKERIKTLEKKWEEISRKKEVVNRIMYLLSDSNFGDYFFKLKLKSILDIANVELINLTDGIFQFILSENDELIIKRNDRNGEELPPEALSGGEKTLVSLALAIAVSESFVGNVGALFIDEGFSALDAHNREKIVEILRRYENLGRVIIFITHFEDLSSRFANVLRMENGVMESEIAISN
ncbi:MAG: SMC family ATPase [Thermotogaceae bacterium]|nr:SMC family ATPase [Thermotogaceae bacterium]